MTSLHYYPSSTNKVKPGTPWIPWRRLSVSSGGTPSQEKARNLRKKWYFTVEKSKKTADTQLLVEAAKAKTNARATPSNRSRNITPKGYRTKYSNNLIRSLVNDQFKDYLENNTITSLPPIELINRVSISPPSVTPNDNEPKTDMCNSTLNEPEIISDQDREAVSFNFEIQENELDQLKIELFDNFSKTFDKSSHKDTKSQHNDYSLSVNQPSLSLAGKHIPKNYFIRNAFTPNRSLRKTANSNNVEKALTPMPISGAACQSSEINIDIKIGSIINANECNKISPWQPLKYKGILKKFNEDYRNKAKKGIKILEIKKENKEEKFNHHVEILTDVT
ncbi:unnamed protein product [Blepharisma stoltei]|uniref:Uncharacterized protein n=1 Tax=Blepharisma stoltei TaxID=1481888 RepID=A0AAU9IJB8_9CILI|nr:unnamed protein product [Blepharisma stoltei]